MNGDFGVDEPAPPRGYAGRRTGSDRLLPLVGGLALVAALIGAVFVVRQPAPAPPPAVTSAPTQTPGADVLDWTGVGQVRLGTSLTDLRASFGRSGMTVIRVDAAHDCRRYTQSGSDVESPWAWVRDGEVVTVGVQFADGLPTIFGPAMGSSLRPGGESLSEWLWDTTTPVAVARSTRGAVVATLADITGEGRLSYATVGTVAGDECEPGPTAPSLPFGPAIEGSAMEGVTLGMTVEQVTATSGWFRSTSPQGDPGCVSFLNYEGAGAELVLGRGVVSLSSSAGIADGPIVGQSAAQAMELLRSTQVSRQDRGVTVVTGTLPDGREVTLLAAPVEAIVEGLDVPVRLAGTPLADQVVDVVTLGQPCSDWG